MEWVESLCIFYWGTPPVFILSQGDMLWGRLDKISQVEFKGQTNILM